MCPLGVVGKMLPSLLSLSLPSLSRYVRVFGRFTIPLVRPPGQDEYSARTKSSQALTFFSQNIFLKKPSREYLTIRHCDEKKTTLSFETER